MIAWNTTALNVVATLFVQTTVLFGGALLLALMCRRAALRAVVLRVALVAAICLPAATVLMRAADAPTYTMSLPAEPVLAMVSEEVSAVSVPISALPSGAGEGVDNPAGVVASSEEGDHVAIIPLLWIAGAGLLLARLAMGHLWLMRLRHRARPVEEASAVALLREAADRLGVRPPRVRRSVRIPTPMLSGILRPMLILPEAVFAEGEDDDEARDLCVVMFHELAHLHHHDCAWFLLARLVRAALFFQPLAWVLTRAMQTTSDRWCDDAVLNLGLPARRYADTLVRWAERSSLPGWAWGGAVGMGRFHSALGRRVECILAATAPSALLSRRALAAAALVCAALCLVSAGLMAERAQAAGEEEAAGAAPVGGRPDELADLMLADRPTEMDVLRNDAIRKALRTTVSLKFEQPTELEEVVDFLNDAVQQKTGIKGVVRIDPRVIEKNPRRIQIAQKDIPLHRALVLIVTDATTSEEEKAQRGPTFFHYKEGGVVFITTRRQMCQLLPRAEALRVALEGKVSLEYEVPTELTEIVKFLNEIIKMQTGFVEALRVDPRIVELDPRSVRIVQINVPIKKALNLLLTDATTQGEEEADRGLVYFIYEDASVVYITNKPRMVRLMNLDKKTQSYDVTGLATGRDGVVLLDLLTSATGRQNWSEARVVEGFGTTAPPTPEYLGRMLLYRESVLVVQTTPELHEKIAELLATLRKTGGKVLREGVAEGTSAVLKLADIVIKGSGKTRSIEGNLKLMRSKAEGGPTGEFALRTEVNKWGAAYRSKLPERFVLTMEVKCPEGARTDVHVRGGGGSRFVRVSGRPGAAGKWVTVRIERGETLKAAIDGKGVSMGSWLDADAEFGVALSSDFAPSEFRNIVLTSPSPE